MSDTPSYEHVYCKVPGCPRPGPHKRLTSRHLAMHDLTAEQYDNLYGRENRLSQAYLDKVSQTSKGRPISQLMSPETKEARSQKISQASQDPKRKQQARQLGLQRKGKKASAETRLKMSEAARNRTRKPHSEETKQKMREAALLRHKTWRVSGHSETSLFRSQKTGKELYCRSSFELAFARLLEESERVVDFNLERLRVDGLVMDFDVEFDDGRKVIVEIKPADFYDEEKLERQRDSASSLGYEFYTLTQFQLTEMAQDLDFGADDFDLFACNPTFWRNLEDEKQKQQIVARTVSSLAGRSFPYPSFSEETLHKDWDTLAPAQGKTEDEQFHLVENGKGNRIIYHFQPEIWHTRCMAPRSGVAYDYYMENLPKLVENRFIYADQMTEASLRRGLRFLVSTPTSMSPALAWACYLLSDKSSLEGLSILDPCAGWGGRFLAATKAGAHYTGFDPNDRAIAGINQMAEFLELRRPNIGNIPFEDAGLGDSKFDIAFTSPPYYRKELYHGSNQSHERYKTYTEWLEGFLKVLIRKSTEALKPGGVLILNLGDYLNCNIQQDTKQYLSTLGRVDRVPLRYRRMFNKKGNLLTRDESIFILKV